jgi:hypothetical protein
MVAAMANWLEQRDIPFQLVNLDPGADLIPYEPDVDVRDWMTLADIMEEYELGPNGGQIVAADMLALYSTRIREQLDLKSGKYIIFDTPGQFELFTFREASRELVSSLVPNSFIVYLVDPFNARTPSGFISQIMLSSLARMRFMIPSLEVLSKSDIIEQKMMDDIKRWQEYPEHLQDDILDESKERPSMSNELSVGLARTIDEMGLISRLFPVSSANADGIQRVYETVQLSFGGGEDKPTGSEEE